MSNIIAESRNSKGVTQKEVAETIDIPLRTLVRYEQEKCIKSAENLKKLADYFEMSMDSLYNKTVEDRNSEC